jgi:hypothetical protein
MDYSRGKELWKYQWDWIHDPAFRLYLFQEEKDVEIPRSNMKYDANINCGGVADIIKYIVEKKGDKFNEIVKRHINGGLSMEVGAESILLELFNNQIKIDIYEEAAIIVKIAYQIYIANSLIEYQDDFFDYIDNADEEDDDLVKPLLKSLLIEFATCDIAEDIIKTFIVSYTESKFEIISQLMKSEQKSLIYSMTNTQLKKFLRNALHINENKRIAEIIQTRHTISIKEVEDIFKNSNLPISIQKQIAKNTSAGKAVELESLLTKTNTAGKKLIRRTRLFANIKSVFQLIDVAIFFAEPSPVNVAGAFAFSKSTLWVGFLTIIVENAIDKFQQDIEQDLFANLHRWSDIKEWQKNNINQITKEMAKPDLLLQYTDQLEKYNFIEPTSIRILNKVLATDIFGFEPKYVNYNYPQISSDGKFHPSYYVPFDEK